MKIHQRVKPPVQQVCLDRTLIGKWSTTGNDGMHGVKNANRVAYSTGLTLKAGCTYAVYDSDPDNWSNNGGSDYKGFFEVKGVYNI